MKVLKNNIIGRKLFEGKTCLGIIEDILPCTNRRHEICKCIRRPYKPHNECYKTLFVIKSSSGVGHSLKCFFQGRRLGKTNRSIR